MNNGEPEVVPLVPGAVIKLSGVAGRDGVVLDLQWEESGNRLIIQGPGAFVQYEAWVRLKDRGRGKRRRVRDWIKWWFMGEEGAGA